MYIKSYYNYKFNRWKEQAIGWTLANAFPLKITVSDMKSDGNEVAVESIELAQGFSNSLIFHFKDMIFSKKSSLNNQF
jgi:hypothetical protein